LTGVEFNVALDTLWVILKAIWAKHPTFSTNHLAPTNKTKHN